MSKNATAYLMAFYEICYRLFNRMLCKKIYCVLTGMVKNHTYKNTCTDNVKDDVVFVRIMTIAKNFMFRKHFTSCQKKLEIGKEKT